MWFKRFFRSFFFHFRCLIPKWLCWNNNKQRKQKEREKTITDSPLSWIIQMEFAFIPRSRFSVREIARITLKIMLLYVFVYITALDAYRKFMCSTHTQTQTYTFRLFSNSTGNHVLNIIFIVIICWWFIVKMCINHVGLLDSRAGRTYKISNNFLVLAHAWAALKYKIPYLNGSSVVEWAAEKKNDIERCRQIWMDFIIGCSLEMLGVSA